MNPSGAISGNFTPILSLARDITRLVTRTVTAPVIPCVTPSERLIAVWAADALIRWAGLGRSKQASDPCAIMIQMIEIVPDALNQHLGWHGPWLGSHQCP